MRLHGWTSRRARATASVSTVSVFFTAIAAMAIINPGFTSADVKLNDSGVWVTRSDRAMVGRFNVAAQLLDGAVVAGSSAFDVMQQGDTVLVRDTKAGTVSPVDVAGLRLTGSAPVSATFQTGLGATSVGILDPDTGTLWVLPAADVASFSAQTTAPTATKLAKGGVLAVGTDGGVHVAAAADATLTSVALDDTGRPSGAQRSTLAGVRPGDALSITAVGAQTVVLDRTTGSLILPNGTKVALKGADTAELQGPGPGS